MTFFVINLYNFSLKICVFVLFTCGKAAAALQTDAATTSGNQQSQKVRYIKKICSWQVYWCTISCIVYFNTSYNISPHICRREMRTHWFILRRPSQ